MYSFSSILFLKRKLTLIQWVGIFTVIAGLVIVGLVTTLFPSKSGNNTSSTGQYILGVVLLLSAMVFTGSHVQKNK
jgi:drug/metabolite transporter (DMT)-like permease